MSTSWSDNPRKNTNQYEKFIFPKLIFKECHKICIPEGVAESDAGSAAQSWLNNWYNKHTTAFDTYMDVSYWRNKNKQVMDYFDLETYTEVETKLGDDMFHQAEHEGKLYKPNNERTFMKDVQSQSGSLRANAL